MHLNKDVRAEIGLLGDAGLTLDALLAELSGTVKSPRDPSQGVGRDPGAVRALARRVDAEARPATTRRSTPTACSGTSSTRWTATTPSSPTTPAARATSSRPSGAPTTPLSYLGWGKTTQLGYGLGLAMGAKLAAPDKLCINVWGDAAIGFTGMDFETAVRERIPILSILLNNFSMAIELKVMPISTEKYRSTDISGDYAAMARAFGGHGERVTRAGGDRAGHPPRHREDAAGRAGAAGVHHLEGDAGLQALERPPAAPREREDGWRRSISATCARRSARSRCCTASAWTSRTASSWCWSGPPAAASPPCCACWRGSRTSPAARSPSAGAW